MQGVVNVGSAGVVEGLTDFFSKKESERGVKVTESSDGGYEIEVGLYLNLERSCKNGCCHSGKYKGTNPFHDRNQARSIDIIIDDIKWIIQIKMLKK